MSVTGVTINGKVVDSQASSLTGSQIYALKDDGTYALLSTKTDKDVNTHSFTAVRTRRLRICARPNTDGGSYPSRLTDITITAQKQTGGTESTSSDYDYKVGSGSMIFDEVTISKDISIATGLTTDTHERTLAVNVTNMNYNTLYTHESGTGYTGTGTVMYYNTTENLVQRYSSGVLQSYRLSLPIARIKADGSVYYGSISQVFNGFGYIGSHMFRYKGIKFLAPNGFKDDESYNSTEVETTGLLLKEISAVNPYTWYNLITKDAWYNNTEYYIQRTAPTVSTNAYWYNNAENKLYRWSGSKWEQRLGAIIGTTVTSNKKVQSISIKKVQPAKRGLPVKGIYLGSKNTNCLTYIPQDISLSLDPLNATVVGSPTISSGVVSGFSASAYVKTTGLDRTTNSFEAVFKTKITTHKTYNDILTFNNSNYKIGFNSSGQLCCALGSWTAGTTKYSTGTNVWVKLTWDGSSYNMYGLVDNGYTRDTLPATSSWTLEKTVSNTTFYKGDLSIGYNSTTTSEYFQGSIDVSQSYVNINGGRAWQGGTGALTLKKGSKVYIPNGTTGQTETTVTETYECFHTTSYNTNTYIYLKTPYKVGDTAYCNSSDSSQLATSVSSFTDYWVISNVRSDGGVETTLDLGMGGTVYTYVYTRYPSGDLTTTTTEIVPSGDKIFNEVVISSDLIMNGSLSSSIYTRILSIRSDGKGFSLVATAESGTGYTGTSNAIYYNTTENLVQRYNSGVLQTGKYSLPIALIKSDGSIITGSIDQVFNGFGYIGGTGFVLPGVKGFIPHGYNADGTYKSDIINVTKVITHNDIANRSNADLRLNSTELHYGNLEYNSTLNQNEVGGSYRRFASVGKMSITDGKITSLTPNSVQPEKTAIDVSRIYRGATLIYGYGVNDVLFESSTPGTYGLNIKQSGNYEITIVGAGGGGGGSAGSHAWMGANGGSGAVFKGVFNLSKSMLTITVGEGGTGGNSSGANAPGGQNGTDSSINFGSGKLITAGAGRGGHGTGDYGSSNTGAGGTLTITGITAVSTSINQNGVTSSDVSILGNNTGAGGVSTSGKAGTKGQNGYVKIVAL